MSTKSMQDDSFWREGMNKSCPDFSGGLYCAWLTLLFHVRNCNILVYVPSLFFFLLGGLRYFFL
jgi:hypothetical protein